jgi:hypothetical protein
MDERSQRVWTMTRSDTRGIEIPASGCSTPRTDHPKKTAAEWWARRRRGDGGRSEAVVVVVEPVAGGNLGPRSLSRLGGEWIGGGLQSDGGRFALRRWPGTPTRQADLQMLGAWWRPAEHDEPFRAGVMPVSEHPSASCGGPQRLGPGVFVPPWTHPASSGGPRRSHAQGESFRRGRARPSVAPFGAFLTGRGGVGRHALSPPAAL